MTILGTRPEIIRLSRIIEKLDALCEQVVVHTGQNYDVNLSDIFFQQLAVRNFDHFLGARGSFGEQIGRILTESERVMLEERPDRFLVLGDTNSSLAAIIAKRFGVPVFHMEAGNRCYDDRVPEEVNRRLIDHSSDVLLPYTERSRQNLLREGIPGERIFVTGNPIFEVIEHYGGQIAESKILDTLALEKKGYFLVTLHRAENVDVEERLKNFVVALDQLSEGYGIPVVTSTHPHTRARMCQFGISVGGDVRFCEPFGFFEFITLERNARCVLSDSGTVQEECCILRIPNVTVRDVTERPETVECGSNILAGVEPGAVEAAVAAALDSPCNWEPPAEYLARDVSSVVAKLVLGYRREGAGADVEPASSPGS